MSELGDKQKKFPSMVARLIVHAEALGYALTFGDAFRDIRCDYGHADSLHRKRIAIDLNLFRLTDANEWEYLTETEDHEPLGAYWKSIGGSWGGDWGDGNHYSIEHEGVR